jgi:phenylalanyl-tRNA synthetase beta chain
MHHGGPDPRLRDWRRVLVERGYLEAITYSFTDAAMQERVLGAAPAIALENPIASDLAVMRRGLLPGLLGALAYNNKRQQPRVRLFEIGRGYREEDGDIAQPLLVGGVVSGQTYPEQWDTRRSSVDFYDVKGDVEALLSAVGLRDGVRWKPARRPGCHPGQCATVVEGDHAIGYIASLHPALLAALDLEGPVLCFELEADRIRRRPPPHYRPVSRFPSVRRDIAVVVDRDVPVQAVLDVAATAAGEVVTNLELFDVYQGEGIDLGKKSLALGLTFQATSSTLTDHDVDAVIRKVLRALQERLGGMLRE